MTEEDDEKEKEGRKRDPFRDFGFGDMDSIMSRMMKDFERMFSDPEMSSVMDRMMKDFEGMLNNPEMFRKVGKPKVYGFSLKVGPDGKPVFQSFGDVQKPIAPKSEDVREPFSDVIDKEKEINVIVELPGVEKDGIKVGCKDNELTVEAEKDGRKYFKKIELPAKVVSGKLKTNYKNGILEIVIPKA